MTKCRLKHWNKITFEAESNQLPKDDDLSTTVLRSTNWAIKGVTYKDLQKNECMESYIFATLSFLYKNLYLYKWSRIKICYYSGKVNFFVLTFDKSLKYWPYIRSRRIQTCDLLRTILVLGTSPLLYRLGRRRRIHIQCLTWETNVIVNFCKFKFIKKKKLNRKKKCQI